MYNKNLISDDELNNVSGGLEVSDDPQKNGRCPNCGDLLVKEGPNLVCNGCDNIYDKDRNLIGKKNKKTSSFLNLFHR